MSAKSVLLMVSALMLQVASQAIAAKPGGGGTGCQSPVPVNPVVNSCTTNSDLPGCLDATFNGTGLVTTGVNGTLEPTAVKQDAAGNLFVIGQVNYSNGTGALVIVHYLADGTLDQGFATGGVLVDASGGSGTYDAGMDAAGNLLVGASIATGVTVRRYSPAGVPDSAFNSNAATAFSALTSINRADALRIQGDGKIVVSGDYIVNKRSVGFVFRINGDGTTDTTFGSSGLALVSSLTRSRGATLQTIGGNNYFVLGGIGSSGFGLVRLNASGAIDSTFGSGGITNTSYCASAAIFSLSTDATGNILAAGETQLATNGAYKLLVARYTPNGILDTTFGNPSSSSGTRTGTTVLDTYGGTNQITEIIPENDSAGHILLAGNAYLSTGSFSTNKYLFIARYNQNGTLDSTFGSGGVAATDFGYGNNYVMNLPASNLTVQADGKLVVTGGATLVSGGSYVSGVARYWP